MGPAHLAISSTTNRARYCGDLRSGATAVTPISRSRLSTTGLSIAWLVASLSRLTISGGAPFGRKKAFQVTMSKSVNPCSWAVGKSRQDGRAHTRQRRDRLHLSRLDHLDRAADVGAVIIDLSADHVIQGRPAAAIGNMRDAGPDRRVELRAARCVVVPVPAEPNCSLAAFAFT